MMLVILIIFFSIQFLIAVLLNIGENRLKKQVYNSPEEKKVSILVPFHNEEDRILNLIESLNNSNLNTNIELIFINDYSDDETVRSIEGKLTKKFVIIDNQYAKGKKYAVKSGVEKAAFDFILTLDADVLFSSSYLSKILSIPEADLVILPVKMRARSLVGRLANIEFEFLKRIGNGLASLNQEIICNGANLIFRKSAFLALEEHRKDYDIASGDDLFLLNAMKKHSYKVLTIGDPSLSVETNSPDSFFGLFKQRKRWFGKMMSLFNGANIAGLLLLSLTQIAFLFSILYCVESLLFLVPIGIKLIAEAVVIYQLIRKELSLFFVLIIHQFWYPIYALLLFFPWKKEKRWT